MLALEAVPLIYVILAHHELISLLLGLPNRLLAGEIRTKPHRSDMSLDLL